MESKRGRVAMLGWEQPAEIFEAKTLIHYRTLVADKKPIHFAFSPDENVFSYCENTTEVEIYHADTREATVIETGNHQPEMEFSPDGKLLGTGGYGTRAYIWNVATGKLRQSLDMGPTDGGLRVIFSSDGKTAAVSHRNDQARLFDVASGKQLHVLPMRMTHQLAFDRTGKRVAVAYVDGTVALFDVPSGKQLCAQASGAKEMYNVDWSPDGDLLVSAGLQGDVIIWDPTDLSIRRRLPSPEWVIGVKFTPDGTRSRPPDQRRRDRAPNAQTRRTAMLTTADIARCRHVGGYQLFPNPLSGFGRVDVRPSKDAGVNASMMTLWQLGRLIVASQRARSP